MRGDYRSEVEIASELLTDAQRQVAIEVASGLCLKACASVADIEATEIARAILHEAINSSARCVADNVVIKAAPGARETVDRYLRDASRYPNVMQAVAEAAEPAARDAALAAVRAWSKERALTAASEAARKVLLEQLPVASQPMLESAVLATLLVLFARSGDQTLDLSMKSRLEAEAEKAALEAVGRSLTPEVRRAAQSAAVIAAGAVAKDASVDIAAEAAEAAARQSASETVRQEVLSLIKAEAQRRAARETREALKDVSGVPVLKVQQHCYDEAMRVAKEAANKTIAEIALASLEVDSQRVFELAAAAASAVAREVSDALAPAKRTGGTPWTLILVAVQSTVGCILIWYFALGGSAQVPLLLKPILPPGLYQSLYPTQGERTDGPADVTDPRLNDVLDGESSGKSGAGTNSAGEIDLDNPKQADLPGTEEGAENEALDTLPELKPTAPLESAAPELKPAAPANTALPKSKTESDDASGASDSSPSSTP